MDEFGIVSFSVPLRWSAEIKEPKFLQLLHRQAPTTLRAVWSAIPKTDREHLSKLLRRVFTGATVVNALVPIRGSNGTTDLLVRGRVSGEGQHRLIEGVLADISSETSSMRSHEVASRDRATLAVQELNHRVRNIMSVVTALITLSGRYAEDVEDFSRATLGRIQALNVAYSNTGIDPINPHLLRQTVDLRTLAEGVLAPFAYSRASLSLSSAPLYLSPGQASAVGLILYELGSNAAEHGALRSQGGRVCVDWQNQGPRFEITWRERGGPQEEAFVDGFGISIIKLFCRNYLNGEATWDHKDGALTVSLRGFEN
ncbi:sensor histidine kinase [Parvularcula maris]|uniref:histidine kinase n=1 Tax=Parvularcula maris TaxID=2965077 RepID=A0A9X2L6Q8_9PROT|nr:sensor histidine kinase [Parvularcula maris]MCQ8184103.1 sensor histidine kinase [Parvularcula maris]